MDIPPRLFFPILENKFRTDNEGLIDSIRLVQRNWEFNPDSRNLLKLLLTTEPEVTTLATQLGDTQT